MANSKIWELVHDLNRKDIQDTMSVKEFIVNFNLKLENMFDTNWKKFVEEIIGGEA